MSGNVAGFFVPSAIKTVQFHKSCTRTKNIFTLSFPKTKK